MIGLQTGSDHDARRRLDRPQGSADFSRPSEAADESRILSPQHYVHRHPKGRGEPREHPDDARHFFDDVARGLDGVDSILIVGPASAKHEFFTFVQEHQRALVSKIVGVETADHPTGGQIVAYARRYFTATDRMGSPSVER